MIPEIAYILWRIYEKNWFFLTWVGPKNISLLESHDWWTKGSSSTSMQNKKFLVSSNSLESFFDRS